MTEERAEGNISTSKPKAEQKQLSQAYPVGQWREELKTDYLDKAIEAAQQKDTEVTESLRKIQAVKPETPPSPIIMNKTSILPSIRSETDHPSTTYPVGQNRQVLPDLPLSSNKPPSGGK